MITVNTHEAKTNFSALLKKVELEHETILVCRNGHPIATIYGTPRKKAVCLPKPDKKLAARLKYDPTEPLAMDELPEDLR